MTTSDPAASRPSLSRTTRRVLLELARTAMPAGQRFATPDERAVDRVEGFFARAPRSWRYALEAAAHALEYGPRLRWGRAFSGLDEQRRLAFLNALFEGSFVARMFLRSLLSAMKVAHYDDAAIFAALDCPHRLLPPITTEPGPLSRAVAAASLPPGEEIAAEVVIVGSGAGGAALAAELAQQGVAVVVLEAGGLYERKDFNGRPLEMMRRMYENRGLTGSLGNCTIAIPLGHCVGGTTTINSGTCYRAPERVLRRWREELGLTDFTLAAMEPHFAKVERVLQVTPAEPKHVGGIGDVLARGCAALGYRRHGPLPRNAPDCDGSALCCFGCPTDAKRSAHVSWLPLALRQGAQLVYDATVTKIRLESGRAVGVDAVTKGGQRFGVRARAVVLAAGTLTTPLLLLGQRLALSSGQVGRNLSVHPALSVLALFDDDLRGYRRIPQGYGIEEFQDEGLLFEGAFVPPDLAAGSIALFGRRFTEVMESLEHLAYYGFMIEDTSRGRVRVGPGGQRLVTYFMNEHDVALLKRGTDILCRIYFAAGARAVFPMIAGFPELSSPSDLYALRRKRLRARDFDLTAHHPLGTARMGPDQRSSVVGPSHETHDVPSLFICDGSVVPSSLGVNPQVTIMALATRAAAFVARAVESRP